MPGSVVPPELVSMAPPPQWSAQLHAVEQGYRDALRRIEQEHQVELARLGEAHRAALRDAETQREAELARLDAVHRAALRDLEDANAAEARFLEEAHQRELDGVRRALAAIDPARATVRGSVEGAAEEERATDGSPAQLAATSAAPSATREIDERVRGLSEEVERARIEVASASERVGAQEQALAECDEAHRRLQNELELARLTVLAVASQLDELAKRPLRR